LSKSGGQNDKGGINGDIGGGEDEEDEDMMGDEY
jgi:hypothetical protein